MNFLPKQFRQTSLQMAIEKVLNRRGWYENDPERTAAEICDFVAEVRELRNFHASTLQ